MPSCDAVVLPSTRQLHIDTDPALLLLHSLPLPHFRAEHASGLFPPVVFIGDAAHTVRAQCTLSTFKLITDDHLPPSLISLLLSWIPSSLKERV
jgi:hypothetical protein